MEKITKNTRFIEFLYTLPIWVFVMPYSIILTRLIIYKFKKKNGENSDLSPINERVVFRTNRFLNIFLSTITWFCLYKIFLK